MECDSQEYKNRISRIGGQVAALEKMYDDRRTAQEILQQVIAVRSSLASLAKLIVEAEVKGCLPSDKSDKPISQLVDTLFKIS